MLPQQILDWGRCDTDDLPNNTTARCTDLNSATADGIPLAVPLIEIRTDKTSDTAPPLVVTAGPHHSAASVAQRFATNSRTLIDAHPIVVVGHRGLSGPPDGCVSPQSREALDAMAQRGIDPLDPSSEVPFAETTVECLDLLEGVELEFGARGAARDLDSLRAAWEVNQIAVLGMGHGAHVAMQFAANHPDNIAMLLVDSLSMHLGDQERAARTALDGAEAALHQWAVSCVRTECGRTEPSKRVEVIREILSESRDESAAVEAVLMVDVITGALGDISGASEAEASDGDRLLGELIDSHDDSLPQRIRTQVYDLRSSTLPWVARCSDFHQRVPVSRVDELEADWGDEGPTFGAIAAARLPQCSTWPVPQHSPVELPSTIPVLALASMADPVAGAAGVDTLAAELSSAGSSDVATVTWHSPGSHVLWHSRCAVEATVEFLADPAKADGETFCPS